jgi:hypothetical protein
MIGPQGLADKNVWPKKWFSTAKFSPMYTFVLSKDFAFCTTDFNRFEIESDYNANGHEEDDWLLS